MQKDIVQSPRNANQKMRMAVSTPVLGLGMVKKPAIPKPVHICGEAKDY
jgi:hypothetical protein